MSNGFQFIDIIFFAMIAAFLVLRLRSVLGRRDGHEGGHQDPFLRHRSQEQTGDKVVHLPDRSDISPDVESPTPGDDANLTLANGISQIKKADSRFDIQEFLTGARMAFEMILGAFAAGDTAQLKPLVSSEVFANFAMAIKGREDSGEVLDDTLVGIRSADIVEAYMENHDAHITVKFVSEQVSVVRNGDGAVIEGDPDAITEVTDFWTFAHGTKSRDPNWILVATRSLD